MADDFRALAIFASVAEAGSFSSAARKMKLSTSVVSHHVSGLEARMGVALFYRSTRSLSLTPEGEKVLPAARRVVASASEAFDLLAEDTEQLSGTLRITMPTFGTHTDVHQRVWQFAKAHPMVRFSLRATDRPVDLVREGLDLGIRLGQLSDSTLKVRRIGSFRRVLVGAPDYLAQQTLTEDPISLLGCDFISFSMLPKEVALQRGAEQVILEPRYARLEVDTVAAGKAAVLAGLGLQRLPASEVQDELASGALQVVMPGWHPPELGVYAVWPDTGAGKNLTRRFVDFLAGGA